MLQNLGDDLTMAIGVLVGKLFQKQAEAARLVAPDTTSRLDIE